MRRTIDHAAAALTAALLLWLAGLVWFVYGSQPATGDRPTPTDAIVVLTGGSLRVARGLDLLDAGKARKLFVSGVNQQVDLEGLLHANGHLKDPHACCIVLGHEADNTVGNARETARWMRQERYRSLQLVTSWYHMRRSLLEFGRVMPGIEIVAKPVFPDQVRPDGWWLRPASAVLMVGEYDKYLAAWVRPLVDRVVPGLVAAEFRDASIEP